MNTTKKNYEELYVGQAMTVRNGEKWQVQVCCMLPKNHTNGWSNCFSVIAEFNQPRDSERFLEAREKGYVRTQ